MIFAEITFKLLLEKVICKMRWLQWDGRCAQGNEQVFATLFLDLHKKGESDINMQGFTKICQIQVCGQHNY